MPSDFVFILASQGTFYSVDSQLNIPLEVGVEAANLWLAKDKQGHVQCNHLLRFQAVQSYTSWVLPAAALPSALGATESEYGIQQTTMAVFCSCNLHMAYLLFILRMLVSLLLLLPHPLYHDHWCLKPNKTSSLTDGSCNVHTSLLLLLYISPRPSMPNIEGISQAGWGNNVLMIEGSYL